MKAKEAIKKAIKGAHEKKPGIILPSEDIYSAILKAGMQVVVEWIEKHHWEESSVPGYIDYGFNEIPWKTQLKEWGL